MTEEEKAWEWVRDNIECHDDYLGIESPCSPHQTFIRGETLFGAHSRAMGAYRHQMQTGFAAKGWDIADELLSAKPKEWDVTVKFGRDSCPFVLEMRCTSKEKPTIVSFDAKEVTGA